MGRLLKATDKRFNSAHTFCFLQLNRNGGEYRDQNIFFVKIQDKGMVAASCVATASIIAFRPKLIAMTGICAGRSGKTKLGDLVIAKQTFDYEAGKIEESGKRHRPNAIPISQEMEMVIDDMNLDIDNLIDDIPNRLKSSTEGLELKLHIKHMASGSSVLCNSSQFEELTRENDEVYGVDMEAYGIAYAARKLRITWIVIKGIQDFGDKDKGDTEKDYRDCAAYASALLLKKFIDSDDFQSALENNV